MLSNSLKKMYFYSIISPRNQLTNLHEINRLTTCLLNTDVTTNIYLTVLNRMILNTSCKSPENSKEDHRILIIRNICCGISKIPPIE